MRNLSPEMLAWLADQHKKFRFITRLAEEIGIPQSTMRECMIPNHPLSKRSWEKIHTFHAKQTGQTLESEIPATEVTGKEVPDLASDQLTSLFCRFEIGTDVLMPVLKKLANGDRGSRMALHKRFSKELTEIFALVRALQSESMRDKVLAEIGRLDLP